MRSRTSLKLLDQIHVSNNPRAERSSQGANIVGNPYKFLLPASHGLLTHFNQAGLRLTIWKAADGSSGLVGIFLSQSTGLFNAVASIDNLAGLELSEG